MNPTGISALRSEACFLHESHQHPTNTPFSPTLDSSSSSTFSRDPAVSVRVGRISGGASAIFVATASGDLNVYYGTNVDCCDLRVTGLGLVSCLSTTDERATAPGHDWVGVGVVSGKCHLFRFAPPSHFADDTVLRARPRICCAQVMHVSSVSLVY